MRKVFFSAIFLALALGLLAAACGPGEAAPPGTASSATASPAAAVSVASALPALTASASPSLSPTLSLPTPMVTLTPSPTLHPMHILAARQTPYPGSEITIEERLDAGINYYRYYASYRSEGLKIYGLLTVPIGEMPPDGWPAIVFNHGYIPPEVYRTTERYIAYVDSLARNGYIVFRIDYRGHDRSEGEATGAYGDPGYLVDVLNAAASLRRFPQADPQRIGLWGHSMGGFLALRAMVIDSDIRAGVIWAGVVASYPDLICCWRRPTPGVPTPTLDPNFRPRWRDAWQERYGTPADNPEFWQGISANSYLADLSGPLQLHHGAADDSVPVEFSQTLYRQLQDAGKTVEYYEYPGDDHNLAQSFNVAMQRTLAFYDRYLKNAEVSQSDTGS